MSREPRTASMSTYNVSGTWGRSSNIKTPNRQMSRASTLQEALNRISESRISHLTRADSTETRSSRSSLRSSNPTTLGGLGRAVGGVVKRRKHIVLLGLDGSGKTTILMRLKYGCLVATTPTIGFNHEKVWGGGFRWSAWDVGGGEKLRPLWATYARATDGIVFVVDSSSHRDVIEEARVELSRVVKISTMTSNQLALSQPPILVLANFQDCYTARGPQEMAYLLGLSDPWASGVRWAVAPVCGLTGEGLEAALETLRTLIDENRKEKRRRDKSLVSPPRWRW